VRPAWSVILLTTLIGAGQGLFLALFAADAYDAARGQASLVPAFVAASVAASLALVGAGLLASFFHLGHPERAWRSAAMWRTSWLSREVIVLPAFIAICALWWLALRQGWDRPWLPQAALVLAAALWLCTAMIYACIHFIREWAQPLTLVNFTLIGLSSGLVLACALAAWAQQRALLLAAAPIALVLTVAAGATRLAALRRNARLKPTSSLQSATGIRTPQLKQMAMGMTGGAFNTREFFHGRTPALLLAWGLATEALWPWLLALALQAPGLLAERWFFLAQANHPQNLYYQAVA